MDIEKFIDDFYEETTPEFCETEEYKQAAEEVAQFIEGKTVVTIGDITRALPQHERMLMMLLDTLQTTGRVYWDSYRPLPTMIYAGDRRIPPSSYAYTWETARERTWQHRLKDSSQHSTVVPSTSTSPMPV